MTLICTLPLLLRLAPCSDSRQPCSGRALLLLGCTLQKRYKADRKANKAEFRVVRKGELHNVLSQDLRPGDVVRFAAAPFSAGLPACLTLF